MPPLLINRLLVVCAQLSSAPHHTCFRGRLAAGGTVELWAELSRSASVCLESYFSTSRETEATMDIVTRILLALLVPRRQDGVRARVWQSFAFDFIFNRSIFILFSEFECGWSVVGFESSPSVFRGHLRWRNLLLCASRVSVSFPPCTQHGYAPSRLIGIAVFCINYISIGELANRLQGCIKHNFKTQRKKGGKRRKRKREREEREGCAIHGSGSCFSHI